MQRSVDLFIINTFTESFRRTYYTRLFWNSHSGAEKQYLKVL